MFNTVRFLWAKKITYEPSLIVTITAAQIYSIYSTNNITSHGDSI